MHSRSTSVQSLLVLALTAAGLASCGGEDAEEESFVPDEDTATSSEAVGTTFVAVADAEVRAGSPASNYGALERFEADGAPEREAYVRFDVQGLSGQVTKATLKCWVVNGTNDGPAVFRTGSAWKENAITWNNRPAAVGGKVADIGTVAPSTWVSVDVTSVLSNSGAIGFVLRATSSDALGCASRESDKAPRLVIETSAGPPPPATGSVMMADRLLDSSGLNTKLYYGNVYGYNPDGGFANTDAVISHVIDWGGRVVREHVATSGSARTRQHRGMVEFAEVGIRWHVTIGDLKDVKSMSATQAQAFAAARIEEELDEVVSYAPLLPGGDLSKLIHSLGGPNEVDNASNNGPNWARNARIFQQELWQQATNATKFPALAGIPIAAPSTRTDLTPARAEELAGPNHILQSWCNRGNPHLYQHGISPTDSLDAMLAMIAPISKNYPAIFSETGYNNAGFTGSGSYIGGGQTLPGKQVPEWVASVYAPRALGDFAKRGALYMRFELLDDPDPTGKERESHFGIIRMTKDTIAAATPPTWQPKPEFWAMRRLHDLLRDPGPAFTTSKLGFAITNAGSIGTKLQTLVVQKRNGRHYLLLWRDVDVYEPNSSGPGQELTVSAESIAIQLDGAKTVNVYQPNEATSSSVGSTVKHAPILETFHVAAGGTFTVKVAGNLKVVELY